MDPARRAYQAIVADPNNLKVLLENTFIIASHVHATATDPVKKQAARSTLDSSFRLLTSTMPNVRYRDPSESYDWKDPTSYERQLATLTRPGAKFTDLNSMLTAVAATPATASIPTSTSVAKSAAIDPSLIPVLAAISVTAPTPAAATVATPAAATVATPAAATVATPAAATVATPAAAAASAPVVTSVAEASAPTPAAASAAASAPVVTSVAEASAPTPAAAPTAAAVPETNAGVIPLLATISVTEPTPAGASVPTAAAVASVPTATAAAIDAGLIPLLAAISVTAPQVVPVVPTGITVVPVVPTGVTVVPAAPTEVPVAQTVVTGVPPVVTGVPPVVTVVPTGVPVAQTGVTVPPVAKVAPTAELTPLVVATSMFVDTPKEAAERRTQEDKLRIQEALQQRIYANDIEPVNDTFIRIAFSGFEHRYLEKGQRVRVIPYESMVRIWKQINASDTKKLPALLETKAKYESHSICMGTNVGTIIGFGYPKSNDDATRYAAGKEMVLLQCENGSKHWFNPFLLYPSTRGGNRTRRKSRA